MKISYDKRRELWILDPGGVNTAPTRVEGFEITDGNGNVVARTLRERRPFGDKELYGEVGAYLIVEETFLKIVGEQNGK